MRVGEILDSFLDDRGVRTQLERTGVLTEWGERVGEAIARVTQPRSLADATLFVEVRSSAWMMELDLMKREILLRINQGREDAPVERIVFVLAEGPAATPTRDGADNGEPSRLRANEHRKGRD